MQYKKSEITKQNIIEAASNLFYEKGYNNTTIKDICVQSGVSVSRVNYHFNSKADLAIQISRKFFDNFYSTVKEFIGNTREYSLVSEIIQLRSFVGLLLSENSKCADFYIDMAKAGILSKAFAQTAKEKLKRVIEVFQLYNLKHLEPYASLYANIYAGALASLLNGYDQQKDAYTVKQLQDTFARLFMQLLDMPHDVEDAIMDKAILYSENMVVETTSLTNVRLSRIGPL